MKKIVLLLSLIMLICSFSFTAVASEKAIWQDPNNVVVLWDDDKGEYQVFRSNEQNGTYECIGTSANGSFRDDTVKYPGTYYYKVVKNTADNLTSKPVKAVVSPEDVSSVSVIMYHNFVSAEDIKNGVEFEEYSISPEDFEKDLIWLRDNGYVTITSDDLIKYLEGKKTLPLKSVIISIDDGSYGVYTNAWPLLKKYNMKADFNVIGAQIDATWDDLDAGKTRDGVSAPYCTWEELIDMSKSGEINLCSHTYGLHVYDKNKRIGMSMMENESAENFASVVKKDYNLVVKCIEGWTGKKPQTVAYPYSKRSAESDEIILDNTGYVILMAGEGSRGTTGNYFVNGCDIENQLTLMSRPCRMDGTPIGTYLERIVKKDGANGVNIAVDYLKAKNTDIVAKDYQLFSDVAKSSWYAGSVYYAYLNGLMKGVSSDEFAPSGNVSRAMAATLLNRLAGNPTAKTNKKFADSKGSEWWLPAAQWAVDAGVLTANKENNFRPNDPVSREELAMAMYKCGEFLKLDMSKRTVLESFSDWKKISAKYKDAVSWAAANGIFNGNADGSFDPAGKVTRAQMTVVLRNWLKK